MTLGDGLHRAAQWALVIVFLAFPLSLAVANLALVLTLALWLASLVSPVARAQCLAALRNPMAAPALALFGWVLLATAWSPVPATGALAMALKYLKLGLVPMFLALLQTPWVRRRCWQAFGLALMFTLVVTWLNVWFDFSWTRTHNQGFGVDHTVVKDYISQGVMMCVFASMCAFVAVTHVRRRVRIAALVVWLLASVSVLALLQGRTGYLAWAVSTAAFLISLGLARSLGRGLLAAVGVAALFALVVTASPLLQERATTALSEANTADGTTITSIGARLSMARLVLELAPDALWLGHGTGAYPVQAEKVFTDKDFCDVACPHPHNQFLFFLFDQGLVGLVLFLWFIAAMARSSWRASPQRRALGLAFTGTLCAACVSHSSLWLSTESHCLILMGALVMASLGPQRARPGSAVIAA
ncbi:MAG: O-antigen ligase family protein [Hydrogenophaga sp.]|uniref:O-antigen ligase family protein n=1 Tax=Hydrogenophaga sp. TaxID=1904254 RepID=UPI001E17B15E|nr:O-antigen ligase family protein [Hydrogenophaga sp.]MBX3610050.1 O-antigen ligase family protein [Hydrogenophaga sp.]